MKKAKIMIVEDESVIAMELQNSLTTLGYQVTAVVNTGDKAIEKAEVDNPDIVLMDIRLKGEMDGIEASEMIRTRFDIPVVFLTAYLDEKRLVRAKLTMPFGYILKPVQERDLKVTLEMALYTAKVEAERKEVEKELRTSEKQYRRLVEMSPDFIAVHSDGRYDYINPAGTKLLGATNPEQIIGKSVLDIVHPDYREIVSQRMGQIVAEKSEVPLIEEKLIRLDGKVIEVEVVAIPHIYRGKSAVQVFARDITARKQAERTIQKSEKQYRELVQSSNSIILTLDTNHNIIFINEFGQNFFGYTKEEIIGKNINDTLIPSTESTGRDSKTMVGQIFKNPAAFINNESENIRKNGDRVWVAWRNKGIYDAGGNLTEMLCMGYDITARKKTELALEKAVRNLNRAQRISKTGNWNWNLITDEFEFSDEMFRMFGYKATEERPEYISYQVMLSRVHPEDKVRTEKVLKEGLDRGLPFNFEFRTIPIDTSSKLLEAFCDIDYDETGNPVCLYGTNRDITAEREAENQLKKYQNHLEEIVEKRTQQFETAKTEAEHANQAKTEFLANMSHELRTPLHHINSFSRLGLKKITEPKEKLHKYFRTINESCSRMTRLVSNLLDLSKLELDAVQHDKKPNQLSYVLKYIMSDFEKPLRDKKLVLKIQDNNTILNFNFAAIKDVFSKIIENAVEFVNPDSVIEISFEETSDRLTVIIKNEGIPIPSDELETVFVSFQQSSQTKTGAGGTGLGLSICRRIIENHQGKIWAEENPQGATIKFFLPKDKD